MEVYTSDTCLIEHNAAEEHLFLQCRQAMHSYEFRAGFIKALEYARAHHIKKWLLDLREIGELSESDETWLQVQLFPQIMMYLGSGNYVAVVVAEQCYQSKLLESGLLGLKSYNSFIIINTFCHLGNAKKWLNRKRSNYA